MASLTCLHEDASAGTQTFVQTERNGDVRQRAKRNGCPAPACQSPSCGHDHVLPRSLPPHIRMNRQLDDKRTGRRAGPGCLLLLGVIHVSHEMA